MLLCALVVALPGAGHAPAVADPAACEWRYREPAKRDLGPGRPPVVIGDSVMGWAVKPLARLGFRTDARLCRMWPEGREMVERMRRKGRLPQRIVMALGSNWQIPKYEIRRMLPLLRDGHTLAIVTPREVGGGSGRDAENVRWAARRYPNRIDALDWVRYSRGKDWFGDDGLHVRREHADRYVRCIKQALPRFRRPKHPCSPGRR